MHPRAQVGRHADALAASLERVDEGLWVRSALDRNAHAELLGQRVELREIGDARRARLRDDQRRVDRLGEREDAAAARDVRSEIIGAIGQHLLVQLPQPMHDRVPLPGLEAWIERLGDFGRGDLRADGLDARDAERVGPGEHRGERQARDGRGRHADPPSEPDVVVGGSDANRAEARPGRALRDRGHLRRRLSGHIGHEHARQRRQVRRHLLIVIPPSSSGWLAAAMSRRQRLQGEDVVRPPATSARGIPGRSARPP